MKQAVKLACGVGGSDHDLRFVLAHCGLRICDRCAGKKRKRLYARYWSRILPFIDNLKFLTVTYGYVNPLDEVPKIFSMARKFAKKYWKHGMAVLEIKYNQDRMAWYVHVHFMVAGNYVAQSQLSMAWNQVSGRPILDIRRVWRPRGGLGYLLRYVAKGNMVLHEHGDEAQDPVKLIEFQQALWHRRFVIAWGSFSKEESAENHDLGGSLLSSLDVKVYLGLACPVCGGKMTFFGYANDPPMPLNIPSQYILSHEISKT